MSAWIFKEKARCIRYAIYYVFLAMRCEQNGLPSLNNNIVISLGNIYHCME